MKVEWIDDWPISNEGRNITLTTAGREPIEQAIAHIKPRDIRWRADLGRQSLELGWYQKSEFLKSTLRYGYHHMLKHERIDTPLKNCYSLTERPGYLRLYGNCYDLASPESPAMLLRKQSSYTESFEAKMEFNPRKAGYEAGVVVWWSQYSYATYGLTLRERVDGEQVLTIASRVPTGKPGAIAVCPSSIQTLAHTTY